MGISAYVESWPHDSPDGLAFYEDRLWGDFTAEGIRELVNHERKGATVYAIDEEGNRRLVRASTVSDPAPEPEPERRRAFGEL